VPSGQPLQDQDKQQIPQPDDKNAIHMVSELKQDQSVSLDLTGDITREIFMHLNIRLSKNGQKIKFEQILQVLHQIL